MKRILLSLILISLGCVGPSRNVFYPEPESTLTLTVRNDNWNRAKVTLFCRSQQMSHKLYVTFTTVVSNTYAKFSCQEARVNVDLFTGAGEWDSLTLAVQPNDAVCLYINPNLDLSTLYPCRS